MENVNFRSQPFVLGTWLVDPLLSKIVADDIEVSLSPKVMALLIYLAESAPNPVSQENLLEKIWPNQVVSDSSLYQAIAQLRKALGDTKKEKAYVERVSGKGYRLIAKIIEPAPSLVDLESSRLDSLESNSTVGLNPPHVGAADSTDIKNRPQSEVDSEQNKMSKKRTLLATFSALILLVLIGNFWSSYHHESNSQSVTPNSLTNTSQTFTIANIQSLAFRHLAIEKKLTSQFSALQAFNDVLMTQLMHIENLTVVNLESDEKRTQENVDALLTGRLVQEDGKLRVFLHLKRIQNHQVVWAKYFEGKTSELFKLQDNIKDELLFLFKRQQRGLNFSQRAISEEAFESYLLARHLWMLRKADSLNKSKTILESLKNKGQLFPLAAVALCETYHFLYIYSNWDLNTVKQACKPLLDIALDAEPNLGQAMAAQALLLTSEGQREQAVKLFEKALRLSPNYADAHLWYANLLRNMGSYQRAIDLSLKAYSLAPMSPVINRGLAYAYLNAADLKAAKYYYQRAITLEPNYIHRPINDLDFFPLTASRAKSFLKWVSDNPKVFQRDPVFKLNLAQVWLALGEVEKATEIVSQLQSLSINPAFLSYVKACIEIAKNRFESAKDLFYLRSENIGEEDSIDLPYIQSLVMTGNYKTAYELFFQRFPTLLKQDVEISETNIFRVMHAVYLQKNMKQNKAWQAQMKSVDSYLQNNPNEDSLHIAEWLVFRGELKQAEPILKRLMKNGWLPDTNAEPFAYSRMKNLFLKPDLGVQEFERLLKINIEIALSSN